MLTFPAARCFGNKAGYCQTDKCWFLQGTFAAGEADVLLCPACCGAANRLYRGGLCHHLAAVPRRVVLSPMAVPRRVVPSPRGCTLYREGLCCHPWLYPVPWRVVLSPAAVPQRVVLSPAAVPCTMEGCAITARLYPVPRSHTGERCFSPSCDFCCLFVSPLDHVYLCQGL